MYTALRVLGVVLTALVIGFLVPNRENTRNVFAAPETSATFKGALANEKANTDIKVQVVNGGPAYRIRLVDVRDDYIVTEAASGTRSAGQVIYFPFPSIRSVARHSGGGLTISIR